MANFAQIQNAVVQNIIVADPSDQFDSNFTWVDIDGLTCTDGSPVSVGCGFTSPNIFAPLQEPPAQTINQQFPDKYSFGEYLVNLVSQSNVASGLTDAQIAQILTQFQPILSAWQTGAIKVSLYLIQQITPDGVLVTQAEILEFENLINAWINGGGV